jgi:hypothetical protein
MADFCEQVAPILAARVKLPGQSPASRQFCLANNGIVKFLIFGVGESQKLP